MLGMWIALQFVVWGTCSGSCPGFSHQLCSSGALLPAQPRAQP